MRAKRTERAIDLSALRDRHRGWLQGAGLLDRPWLVLASAPGPTIPAILPANLVHFHIKYAGHAAKALGLKGPDLTFLYEDPPTARIAGLTFDHVLALRSDTPSALSRGRRWLARDRRRVMVITDDERDAITDSVVGGVFRDVGAMPRPSNGVAMIAYAVFVGVPRILVAGLSVETDGHSYDPGGRVRRHKEEDRASLCELARIAPQVETTEQGLARLTGLALFSGLA